MAGTRVRICPHFLLELTARCFAKRALLVLIGMGAASVMMLVPYRSSRHLCRMTHSTVIRELNHLFNMVVSTWIEEEQHDRLAATGAREAQDGQKLFVARTEQFRTRMLALYAKMQLLQAAEGNALFDLSFRGDFPREEYAKLSKCEGAILQGLTQAGFSLLSLDAAWRKKLVKRTAFLNTQLVSHQLVHQ